MIYFCDIEANGLLEPKDGNPAVTKVHCLSYKEPDKDPVSMTQHFIETFLYALMDGDTLVWHNGFGYDYPVLKKLGIIKDWTPDSITLNDGTVKQVQSIDSLALSREYWPDNPRGHGLEAWAKFLGTYKPHIEDWDSLPIEDYVERCEEDVITTEAVFKYLCDKLGIEI